MATRTISMPTFGLVVATRGMLGAGIGLLLADRLDRRERRAVGLTLAAVGVLTTIPLALEVFQPERMPRLNLMKRGETEAEREPVASR
jgi:hypothetical protein